MYSSTRAPRPPVYCYVAAGALEDSSPAAASTAMAPADSTTLPGLPGHHRGRRLLEISQSSVYYRLLGQNAPTPDSSATSFMIQHWWNSNPYRFVVGTGYFYNFSMPAVTVARSSCVQDVALNFNYELGMAMVPSPSYPLHILRIGADST